MQYLRNIRLFAILLSGLLIACDDNLDEINTNETDATAIDPVFQLNNAIIESTFSNTSLVYDMGIVQQIITPNSGIVTGANYNQVNSDVTQQAWQEYYRDVIKETRDILNRQDEYAERTNLIQMARIVEANAFLILTDSYGSIPYTEAGLAFNERILYPAYDSQESIYNALITELQQATAALDENAPVESAEVLFGGNIEQWRLYGNSLLLRMGMRLSKRDPSRAQALVQEAYEAGVITSNANNVVIRHDANFTNVTGVTLNATEANNYYLAAPFVSYLQSNDDPRLSSIAVRYVGASSGPEQVVGPEGNGSSEPEIQVGMPLGYNNETIKAEAAAQGLVSFYEFSQADRERVVRQTSPVFIVTAAQTQLLLAEAAQRGWISADAGALFASGVRAHMEQLSAYGEASAVAEEEITAYLAAHPYDEANALEQINTQYWVASFLNGPEAFANFRRSGFPDLDPNPFPNQDITTDFIRRITYPTSEIAVNTENVNQAINIMGPDRLDTRVWWDMEE